MKKLAALIVAGALTAGLLSGCSSKEDKTIKVGASITPHAEILRACTDILAEEGYTLEVQEFTDYVLPNQAVESGELDANFFQHQPYLDDFNEKNKTHLVSVAKIHYEPCGIYGGKLDSLDKVAEGSTFAIPNDGTNEARALFLMEAQGLIKLKEGTDFTATILDIAENPLNLKIEEMDAALLARALEDVDFALINGNYALQAGLNAEDDALAVEDKDSAGGATYANVLCVKEGHENDEKIQALAKALCSETVREYIEATYNGSVVPMF